MFLAKREPQPDPVPPAPVVPPVAAQTAAPPTVVDMPRRTDASSIVTSSLKAVVSAVAATKRSARVLAWSGVEMRTMSAPATAQRCTCSMVAATSVVSVLVIVCTEIGASPPTSTRPTRICRDGRR